ncbi:MAG: hypothetical protein SF028_06260 [Candidatus Sumerlaeia bacterium]|nr:hypothetical protein [Candidatus Sumerlaeia bacterium]
MTRAVRGASAPDPTEKPARPKAPALATSAQRLHPIQVEYTYPVGVRTDMERELPISLEDADLDELLELFSSPAQWTERLAPLTAQFNQEQLQGKNPVELELKFLQHLSTDLGRIAHEMQGTNTGRFGERGAVSFVGLGLDPETLSQVIEFDYDRADNSYSRFEGLFAGGHATPVATTPFHTLLPLYKHDFEIRLLVRIGLDYYWPLLKKFNRAAARNTGEKYFIAVFHLPEGAYSARVLQILHAEFTKRCEAESIKPAHLVVLLDTAQSKETEIEHLMKRWNTLRPAPTTRDFVTILFRERAFSDWVVQGHPSTKKQLDRTIAKVDAALRDRQVDHQWAHFEPVATLLGTFKACNNFELKILKLTELGYQPAGPDLFVRRKLLGLYGMEESEPRRTQLVDHTCWEYHADAPGSLSRFLGEASLGEGRGPASPPRTYTRKIADGTTREETAPPVWKYALWCALQRVHRAVVGDPKTFQGGMLGLLRALSGVARVPVMMRNVEDFLVQYARVRFREHYTQQVCSEADVNIADYCADILLREAGGDDDGQELPEEEVVAAGAAAEAVFLAHEGLSSPAFAFENMDNRAVYHNVVNMTLAVVHAIHALNWTDRGTEAAELFAVFQEELLGFAGAHGRHGLEALGCTPEEWAALIAPQVEDSALNVVERAARRVGARHLRNKGFRNEFQRSDEYISTSTGHLWSREVAHDNFKWENEAFCGLAEE